MRKCKVKINIFKENNQLEKEEYEGYFHAWSVSYEEVSNSAVNYPVAIVELTDGRIVLPDATDVVFLDTLN